ncbi:NAD(P)H-hydrate dehydratase [Acidimangrovimonas pyrenivorans]|uniref:Bifunctional NAD(P)H-hydrate repair enzyme n=1 Tax=Acidimangrovimonas pyrenivorans TaxID=2030798 RepID=A0ABV7AF66_9RHOB
MRAIEEAAIASGAVTGLELMERAGRGVVEAVFEEWPELAAAPQRAVVLCGPGNNGGDGFVVARLLREWGWEVEVYLYGDAEKLPPDARVNYGRWVEMGAVRALDEDAPDGYPDEGDGVALIVDAIFGIGLTRPFLTLCRMQDQVNLCNAASRSNPAFPHVVAVDVPSGLSSDSGAYPGYEDENPLDSCMLANLTVTFHAKKLGHVLGYGPDACGKVVVKDIGLEGGGRPRGGEKRPPGGAVGRCPAVPPGERVTLAEPSFYRLSKFPGEHKYSHGHALILSGGPGRGGAARLAARGALRIGAGLVTLGCPPAALIENAAQLNAVMLRPLRDAEALAELLKDGRINALGLGPGLGLDRARALVPVALESGRACVLDADALTAFAEAPELLFGLTRGTATVLTPHGGEFARLFPDIAEKLTAPAQTGPAYCRVDAAREAAARAGCVVLLKGPDTVIADAGGRCAVNSAAYERAVPWLATAGAGDVLAGFIAGLLARGFDPRGAAETAAWLHVECARSFGPGLIAEDLPEELPQVFRALGL